MLPLLQNTQQNDFGPNLAKSITKQSAADKLAGSLGLFVSQVTPRNAEDKRILGEINFYRKEASLSPLSFSQFWK